MNKSIFVNTAVFLAGAAIGSAVTWKIVKTKYEQIAQEEIDSVKEVFARKTEEEFEKKAEQILEDDSEEDIAEEITKAEIRSYRDMVSNSGYTNYSSVEQHDDKTKERSTESMSKDGPYIIQPEEFGEEYPILSLVYYANGVLTESDTGYRIDDEDIDDIIGEESLEHFGDYENEPDSVYVRNDARKTDYEILRDEDDYQEDYYESVYR